MTGRIEVIIYIALPLVLWPLSFDVFSRYFVYGMAISTLLIGSLTLAWFRDRLHWFRLGAIIVILTGILFAFIMYIVFIGGYAILTYLGLSKYVAMVYVMIRRSISKYALAVALAIIGIMEELYWRGGLQELMRGVGGIARREPWLLSMTYYTLIHISTLNPALVAGAFAVGLIDGLLADKVGLTASTITHILWLELMMVILPL
ncbi:CPBP family intramembrane metalloprotease [Vulcanisaeta sp. EB80]|uniref:CPBP family glutamic-type intramembrane protease n=1 Tax=Vulcanisaeta sp. EB80 TaxID=1650660 RepID=UPI0009BE4CFA|nr:CPBP family glutamic-type intramembrane protease [Vulcanisaeta sp. EB80]PLC67765.1 CPBP family intramembrane metalloprotease [Vulcanisaeta sp. EB80]